MFSNVTQIMAYGLVWPFSSLLSPLYISLFKVLSDKNSLLTSVFSTECRDALGQMLDATLSTEAMGAGAEKKVATIQPDSPIAFSQLSKLDSLVGAGDVLDISLKQALGTGKISKADFASSKLSKVVFTARIHATSTMLKLIMDKG